LNGFHLLGWGADYPHVTNFLDYHFGKDQKQFGTTFPEIYDNLIAGGQKGIPADAEADYVAANNAIKELVPMVPIAHGGSAAAYRADVVTPQASPLTTEEFAFSGPGDRDVFVWMQNAEPNTMFCADETDGEGLRACEQFVEGLYGYEVNGTDTYPKLAESCTPNEDATVWTCVLRQGVKFHDGTDFDSADVLATWDMLLNPASPAHKGNTNLWEYAETLWGLMWK
jgi:ABC-type transport system substrate-binding protein